MAPSSVERLETDTARQALWITLTVWVVDLVFFLLPSVLTGVVTRGAIISAVTMVTLGAILSLPIYLLTARLRRRGMAVRIAGLAAAAMACGVIASGSELIVVGAIRDALVPGMAPPAADQQLFRGLSNILGMGWMFALVGATYLILQTNRTVRERERQLADARTAAAEAESAANAARLAALRYQLNPHFLFNTLNAVSSAVITRRNEEAEDMLAKLADFLRVTLTAEVEGLIALEDELATVQAYLEIEAVRFRERLGLDFSCPDDLRGALIPSFILQPLIENAIKHGVSRTSEPVTVRLEVRRDGEDLVLLVEDDAQGAGERPRGTGVGLANVRQRLEVLYGARGALQATARERGFLALVRLPLQWTAGAPAKAA